MKRREFLNRSGLGLAALSLDYTWLWRNYGINENDRSYQPLKVSYHLYKDGSFDIYAPDIEISGCYPVIDEKQVRSLRVNVDVGSQESRIKYDLSEGSIILYFRQQENRLSISSELLGFSRAPHWFMPLGYGQIKGTNRFYKQGFGSAGPSGIFPFPHGQSKIEDNALKEEAWTYDSYLVSGVLSPESRTLCWSVFDNSSFLNRSSFYNRYHRYGLNDEHLHTDKIYVDCGFSMENIILAKEIQELPSINFLAGESPYPTFREIMSDSARWNKVELKEPGFHWCSGPQYQADFSYELLYQFLNALNKEKTNFDLQTIQIDAGYSIAGDWLDANEKWPGGMSKAAGLIETSEYVPGIWVAPFMVSSKSVIYENHKDWLLKDIQGEIITRTKREDESLHILDTSNPGAFEYLRNVFRTFRKWGFRYFKTDFMDWGYQDSTLVQRNTPGKTSAHYFMDVLEMIREEIGPESFWLAERAPFQPFISYADAVRISNDVPPVWTKVGTINMFREMQYGQIFNNLLWQNDPDVLYLRENDNRLSEDEKYSIAFFDAITGGVVKTSDLLYLLDEFDQQVWKMLNPGKEQDTATIYDWENFGDIMQLSRPLREGLYAWLMINISDEAKEINLQIKDHLNIAEPNVYQWVQEDGFISLPWQESLSFKLKAHESVLLYIGEEKTRKPGKYSLSGFETD